MNILLLSQYCDPEPAPHSTPLAEALRSDHNHRVTIVSTIPNYPGGKVYEGYKLAFYIRENIRGTPVLRLPLFPSHDRSVMRRLLTYTSFAAAAAIPGPRMVRLRPDVVYVYHPPGTIGIAALTWKWARRTPFVYHIADMWPDSIVAAMGASGGPAKGFVARVLTSWCALVYREAAAVTVLSEGFKALLVSRGVPASKIHVVYNWAEESIFRPFECNGTSRPPSDVKGQFSVVYAGNLGDFQDLGTAIRAASRVASLSEFRLVIIGSGTEYSRLRELARSLGASNVVFRDRLPYSEMGTVNALADCLLVSLRDLPLFEVTIPSKLQVALASARPVIGCLRGEAAAIIRRAGAGFTCDPGDDRALSVLFERMCRLGGEERACMGASGRQYYERHMSLSVGAAKVNSVLESVCK